MWHAGSLCCQTPDEASFAAVRVHYVWLERRKRALELPVGEPVAQRMNGPDEIGDAVKESVDFLDEGLERAFRAGGGTAVKPDIDARFFVKAEDGGGGVFLRAANNEAGDDMRDAHGLLRAARQLFHPGFNTFQFLRRDGLAINVFQKQGVVIELFGILVLRLCDLSEAVVATRVVGSE